MRTTAELDRKQIERENNRTLLVVYDLIVFLGSFYVLFVIRPSDYNPVPLSVWNLCVQALVPMVCVFGFRFLFRVYKQVLRYGNMRALARLLAADVLGGCLYIAVQRMLPEGFQVSALRAGAFVMTDFAMAVALRIAYYYVYFNALQDTWYGHALKAVLETLGRVDVGSEEGAVLPIFGKRQEDLSEPINEILLYEWYEYHVSQIQ